MAGAQRAASSVPIPLFALYWALHIADARFPVDSFIPDHKHQNLRAAEHPARALHTCMVVHHSFDGLLVHPAVASLYPDGVRRSPLSFEQQSGITMCAVSDSSAALHCHAAVSYIRLKRYQQMIPSIVPHIPRILTTTALCLAVVGVSSCSCQQGCPLLEEALYVNDTSDWYAAEKDMTNFYHVTATCAK